MTATKKKGGGGAAGTYADYPEDAQLRIIDRYHDRIHELRSKKLRTSAGQVYTPYPVVEFMVRSVCHQYDRARGSEWASFYALDPFCGAGVFLLAMARHLHARQQWAYHDILERPRVGGCDLDLGALVTARTMLRTLPGCAEAEPRLFWSDTLADFFWLLDGGAGGADTIDPLHLGRIDRLNAALAARSAVWQAHAWAPQWTAAAADSDSDTAADSGTALFVPPSPAGDLRPHLGRGLQAVQTAVKPLGVADLNGPAPRLRLHPDTRDAMPADLRDALEVPLLE